MEETYLTFKKFNDIGLATQIGEQLKANQIEFIIEDNNQFFDVTFANNNFQSNINLKIKSKDFHSAKKILNDYYKEAIKSVDEDYYLFEFSNQELFDIISKPGEWGEFDYQLAEKILSDRNCDITPEKIEMIAENQINELSEKEKVKKYSIYEGYFYALLGGFLAIIFGYNLAYSKKTIPNGKQIYTYEDSARKHGERIFFIGIVSLIFWIALIFFYKSQQY